MEKSVKNYLAKCNDILAHAKKNVSRKEIKEMKENKNASATI